MTNSILGALINGAFVAALLGGAVWAGLALAPRRLLSANARYAVWWTTLVAALLLPLGYLPSRQAGTSRPASAVPALAAAPLLATNAPASLPRPLPSHRLLFPLVLTAGGWPRWLLEAWAVVSGLMLIRLLSSCRLLERRKAGAAPAPDHLTAPIDVWLARRGCRRRAAMLSAHIATPVLAGLRRPAILIPERLFAELTEDELLQIGLHEAAHLARRDDYALFVQRAVEALLPVHPVVRWIARQIDLERELACDDLVVGTTGAPREYAACLARVVELCGGARPSWAGSGVAGGRSQLAKRVDCLLDRHRRTETRPARARVCTAIGIVALMACLAGRTPRAIALAMPAEVTAPPVQVAAPVAPQAAPSVIVPVSVTDSAGRSIAGLTRQDFRLLEDGVEQPISEVTLENVPLSIEIVVDMSGSMGGRQPLIDAAITQLVKAANPADEFLLVTFNDEVHMAGPFPNDPGQILGQAHLTPTRGGTSLRDAIYQAVQWNKARYRDRILVVFSDGVDNSSSLRAEELRDAVLAAKTPIYTILLASPEDDHRRQQAWLRDFAQWSPGQVFAPMDFQVPETAATVANLNVYALKYRSTNPALDGKFRRLKVDVVTAAGGSLKVRTRSGYYANGR